MKESVESFIQKGPAFIRARFAQRDLLESANWAGVASAVVIQARAAHERKTALEWAMTGDQIFRALEETEGEWAFSLKAMTLRVGMIERWGVDENENVLSPKVIRNWFQATVGDEIPNEIPDRSAGLANLPLQRIRRLRRVKNALGIIRECIRLGAVSSDDFLVREWLFVADCLP